MTYPIIATTYAGAFALLFALLSALVVVLRGKTGIVHGDGGHDRLNRVVRAHANFAEYIPFILLMVGWIEASGASRDMIHWLLGPLLIARLMHPIGMQMPIGSVNQYLWRATSSTITWAVLIACGVLVLLRAMNIAN